MSKLTDGQTIELDAVFQGHVSRLEDGATQPVVKRAVDILVGLGVLAIASPVMAILWLLVRLDGGPGLYGHMRVGRDGKMFRCLKFRTMVTNSAEVLEHLLATDARAREEWNRSRKLLNDPRVTRIGRLLRATSLDELPQIFNVLRGDMSLVGPRPVVRSELEQYYGGVARGAYLSVRPGLTGLWQVSGRSDASYDQRVRLDTEYVANASLKQDIVILYKTVAVVLRQRGAY